MRFGVRGRSPGQLQRPTGVTVDMNGDIVVADYDNRWVSIFSSDGKFKVRSRSLLLAEQYASFKVYRKCICLKISYHFKVFDAFLSLLKSSLSSSPTE